MTKKALGLLQEEHSVLCARAADMGISVPDELTIDFDSAEVGSTVVANLEALIRNEADRLGVDNPNSKVAETADEELSTAAKPKKKKRSKAKQVEDVQPSVTEESDMANARKKQPVAKKAKKSKTTARRAPAAKAKRNSARGTNSGKSQKIIEMMKKSGGVTREQVLKMTGWKAVSMQALAKTAGVKLKVEKSERPFRYSI